MQQLGLALRIRLAGYDRPRVRNMAQALQMHPSSLSYLLNGARPVSLQAAKRLLEVYPELEAEILESLLAHGKTS